MEHDIRFNSKKSAVIIFRNSFVKDFSYPSFVMNDESIKEVPFVKYLGHVISADMKDDLDIMRQCRQLYRGKEVHREAETKDGGRKRWRRQWGKRGKHRI